MTHRTLLRFAVPALVTALAGAVAPARAIGGDPGLVWKTVAASGPVTAREPGAPGDAWLRVVRGMQLPPLSQVQTGRRGRATLASRAGLLVVDPGSRIELPAKPGPGGARRVIQTTGSVVYEVDGSKVTGFKVVTPYLVAGVKGTVFLVTVTDRYASVTVEHGVVEVSSLASGERARIHAGETALVGAEEDAELEVVRPRGAGGEGGEPSRQARKVAEREADRLEGKETLPSDGRDVVPDIADPADAVDDPLKAVASDLLQDVTDPLKRLSADSSESDLMFSPMDALDQVTEETVSADSKSTDGAGTY